MQKGFFIVLDGNDGSGKATQAALMVEYLASVGISAEKIDFPRYENNTFGALIGECLAGKHGDFLHMDPKIASTLYALDRFESSEYIRTAVAEGKVVIADRYASSNQIHQGGKIADVEERKRFMSWLEHVEFEVLGIPRPDAVIYLQIPVEISLELLSQKRKAKIGGLGDGEKDTVEEDRNYLEQSHNTADWLASHQPNWHIVDCIADSKMRTREDIHAELVTVVDKIRGVLEVSK